MRIVVIEDNLSIAKGIRYNLQDAGHAVDIFHNGEEAAAFLRGDDAQMVVLDINLPGKDGLTLLREMRERGDLRPVLLLTARAELGDKIVGLDAGADDYLSKPFEMDEFAARIRALARRVTERPAALRSIGQLTFDEVYVSRLRKRVQPFEVQITVKRGLGYMMQAAS